MLLNPLKGSVKQNHNLGTVGSATFGVSVTTGAAASTKGTAVELISAANNTFDSCAIAVFAHSYAAQATASAGALDILAGASTEDVLIPDLLMGQAGLLTAISGFGKWWWFPLYIPAGTRIAARAAGERVSTAFQCGVVLYGGTSLPPWGRTGRKVTTYGMGTVPNGTAITPGATGAEGSYAQITASTTEDHFAFLPSFQVTNDTTITNKVYQVDIGVGAATEDLLASWMFYGDQNENVAGPMPCFPAFDEVPAGTRLAMRASNSGANDNAYSGVIHAIS